MNMNKTLIFLIVSLTLLQNAATVVSQSLNEAQLAHQDLHSAAELARAKRKVSQLDTNSAGALEYMTKLREQFSDSEGRPLFDRDDDPTSVWCIMDKDMLENMYRPRPAPQAKCTAENRFIFNLDSIVDSVEELGLPVQKAFIRSYLKPIARLLRQGPATVDIAIHVGVPGEGHVVTAGNTQVEVTMETSWMELDVTEGLRNLWPLSSTNHDLEFTITLSVDCKNTKKVPAIFIDPTEVSLAKTNRRQRYTQFQPLLLVFFNDEIIKEQVRNNTIPTDAEFGEFDDEMTEPGHRSKRMASSCTMEDYSIIFHDLHLYDIIIPYMYNARRCTGSCSHHVLTGNHQLGTNHANIMAGAYEIYRGTPNNVPKEPCCAPTRYSSMSIVKTTPSGIDYKVYPAMKVEECGCR